MHDDAVDIGLCKDPNPDQFAAIATLACITYLNFNETIDE
jgi:hypothetical protein